MTDNNTKNEEVLNDDKTKITTQISINEVDAEDILNQLGAKFPPIREISEIVLVVNHEEEQ